MTNKGDILYPLELLEVDIMKKETDLLIIGAGPFGFAHAVARPSAAISASAQDLRPIDTSRTRIA